MSISNPFAKSQNKNINTEPINKTSSQNLPPKAHSQNFPKEQEQSNEYQEQSSQYTPSPPLFNYSSQSYQNNYYNNDDLTEEEFSKMKLEYDSKIKPLNSSSDYISTTSSIFPKDTKTLSQLSIPMSISLCPMKNTGIEIPFVNYEENNIPRCPNRNCRAYMNPFVKFIEGGEKWICNLCGQINDTEDFYYSDVDKNGIRLDVNQKPELCCGSYEFFANNYR